MHNKIPIRILPVVITMLMAGFSGYGQIIDLFPPVANDDSGVTDEDTPVSIDVVANDEDRDLLGGIDPSTVDLNTSTGGIQRSNNTQQGNFSVNAQGIVTYTPAGNFSGTATLAYTVNDNAGKTSDPATITITVNNLPNDVPVAVNDNASTEENTPVTINVVANDTDSDGTIDAATVDLNTSTGGIQSSRNTLQGNYSVNASGVVTYTPAGDFTGTASTAYTVNDDEGAVSNEALITITVNTAPNVAPVAANDNTGTEADTPVTIDVVANDTDSDGTIDATTVDLDMSAGGIQNVNSTVQGSFKVNTQGVVSYTPAGGFTGTASVRYTVNDDEGAVSNEATITIVVKEPDIENAAPVITGFEPGTDTLQYEIGSERPRRLTAQFDVEDADDESLAAAEIGFRAPSYQPANDRLLFDNTTHISGIFNEQTGVLTLTGQAPLREYVNAVRSVEYNYVNTGEVVPAPRKVYVKVSDGRSYSDVRERIVALTDAIEDLDIPTAFTPNGDGANETWNITPRRGGPGRFEEAEIRIYDKRGVLIYKARGLENRWSGIYNGQVLPADAYYYTIDLKDNNTRYKGVVTILR